MSHRQAFCPDRARPLILFCLPLSNYFPLQKESVYPRDKTGPDQENIKYQGGGSKKYLIIPGESLDIRAAAFVSTPTHPCSLFEGCTQTEPNAAVAPPPALHERPGYISKENMAVDSSVYQAKRVNDLVLVMQMRLDDRAVANWLLLNGNVFSLVCHAINNVFLRVFPKEACLLYFPVTA